MAWSCGCRPACGGVDTWSICSSLQGDSVDFAPVLAHPRWQTCPARSRLQTWRKCWAESRWNNRSVIQAARKNETEQWEVRHSGTLSLSCLGDGAGGCGLQQGDACPRFRKARRSVGHSLLGRNRRARYHGNAFKNNDHFSEQLLTAKSNSFIEENFESHILPHNV